MNSAPSEIFIDSPEGFAHDKPQADRTEGLAAGFTAKEDKGSE